MEIKASLGAFENIIICIFQGTVHIEMITRKDRWIKSLEINGFTRVGVETLALVFIMNKSEIHIHDGNVRNYIGRLR